MKKLSVIMLSLAAFLAGCGTEPAGEKHYIKLSDAVCTFLSDGTDSKTVTVRSNPEWSFASSASWLKVSEGENARTLVVSAEPNTEGERSAEVTLTAGAAMATIVVYQLGADGMNARYRLLDDLNHAVMSPSGRYVGGLRVGVEGDNDYVYTAVVIDLESDERVEFGPYPETLIGMYEAEVMTDQGVLYITDNTNGGCVAFEPDGTYYVPGSLSGYGPVVMQGVSTDGSVLTGYTEGTPYGCMYAPVKIVNGEVFPLELPEKSFRNEEWWAGVMARGVSADGTVMYGTSWENYDYGMLWWDETGTPDWVGSDVRKVTPIKREDPLGNLVDYNLVDGVICWANQTQISPDGKWIAGTFRTEEYNAESNEVYQTNYPAFFNTETRTTTVFDEYAGYVALCVTDSGLGVIGAQSVGVSGCSVIDLASRTVVGTMTEWMERTYGLLLSDGVITSISPDMEHLFGYKLYMGNGGTPTSVWWYVAPPLD
ncbi:MAG TPA: BACON domain-containing protein [Candidatus Tidjanibacter gallistercoris]|nr:BACON domain-containing protein [Candidatus Tidjanibacter gallistercoris]